MPATDPSRIRIFRRPLPVLETTSNLRYLHTYIISYIQPRLPAFTRVYAVYPRLPAFTRVYPRLPAFTPEHASPAALGLPCSSSQLYEQLGERPKSHFAQNFTLCNTKNKAGTPGQLRTHLLRHSMAAQKIAPWRHSQNDYRTPSLHPRPRVSVPVSLLFQVLHPQVRMPNSPKAELPSTPCH